MRNLSSIAPKRRGPPPPQCDEHLETWIKDMQANGYPIKSPELLVEVAEGCATKWASMTFRTLFCIMAKLTIEDHLDDHRLYNIDETGFASRKKSTESARNHWIRQRVG
ncbi:hypothetical protein H257_06811 [Aphanomyces astaci]|uniref:HTH CENPB-type domain-containing protein n=1 Tax=Aphanomyces astaci TaxID=112090 RepID=W4GJP8_APHAT|nr:hypothetical protein H257_06811 [Aphanomyces astaci]ETV79546.1 hypothetical protein H257_06811 [Aphanomyces astaci]|eukprot:XP_009830482.1 hypothetical protein H257_06811 [Aphanomyces astaci]